MRLPAWTKGAFRGRRRRAWWLALGVGAVIAVAGIVRDVPHRLAVEARDRLGLVLVEGHADLIAAAARESRIDPTLLGAIMYVESHGRGGQTSSAGALGLMQLVPGAAGDAARRLGIPPPEDDEVRDDDALNVRLGAAHVAWLLQHRGDWSLEQVLVSYNAGRAKLFRWIEQAGGYDAWRAKELAAERDGRGASGALKYALSVLEAQRVLRERGALGQGD